MKANSIFNKSICAFGISALIISNLAACVQTPQLQQYAQNNSDIKSDDYDFDCEIKTRKNDYRNYNAPMPRTRAGSNYSSPMPVAPPPPPPPVMQGQTPANAAAESVIVSGTRASPSIAPYPYPRPHPYPYPLPPRDTERYPSANINGVKQVSEAPVSTFAMETDTASYSNARRVLRENRMPPADAVRVEEFLNYFNYDYPIPRERSTPFSTNVTITSAPWAEQKQIVHIGLQGYDTPHSVRPPLNLVLLMDVSGSMAPENKLPLAKRAVRMMLPNLNANDRISMVVYAGASGVALNPTRGTATRDIVCALENLEAGGSTAGGEGLRLAYQMAQRNFKRDGVNRIILMSDGDFNVGISDPRQLRDFVAQKRDQGIYLSIFGYGGGNYNDEIMQSLAQNGNGVAAYIDSAEEASRVMNRQFQGTMFPIAQDVKAQIEFNPRKVSEYRLIGYETRALNREDFNNDKVDAGEIGARHQVTALYEITRAGHGASVDPLRYQNEERVNSYGARDNDEIAFLRLRYKLPGQSQSRLIERPITGRDIVANYENTHASTRFALAVAAFAQKLRNDPWLGDFSYSQIAQLAQNARMENDNSAQREFLDLVENAKSQSETRRYDNE